MPNLAGAALTHAGLKRPNNEDSFFSDNETGLFLVADGMGGAASGELASKMVAETIGQYVRHYLNRPVDDPERFKFYDPGLTPRANTFLQAIHLANSLVFNAAARNRKHKGMGATLAAVLADDDGVLAANVGDSPVFRLRGRVLEQITREHRIAEDPRFKKMVDPTATLMVNMGHTLTRAMGVADVVEPDLYWVNVEDGDLLMLCSDGLTDMVAKQAIGKVLALEGSIERKAKDLVDLALAGGGRDNVTVVVAEVVPAGRLRSLLKKVKRG